MKKSHSKALMLAGRGCAALLFALVVNASPVRAQDYPSRTVKIVVPSGAGGGYDVFGRLVGDALSRRFGNAFYIENKTGAGTIVGTQAVITSPPDGYTLLVGGLSNIVFNGNLYTKPPYDALKSLVPVAIIYKNSYLIVTSPQLKYKSVKELIAAAKANPNGLNLATAGKGTGQHLSAVAFMKATGTQFQEVPYKGASSVYPDLFAGRLDVFFDSDTGALPFVKSGQVNALAITSAKRSKQAPEIPTLQEGGVPDFDVSSWVGIFAPVGTPKPVIAELRKKISESADELKVKFAGIGGEWIDIETDKIDAFVAAEYASWGKVIKDADVKMD